MTGSFLSSLALTGHPLPFPAAHHPQQHVDVQLPDHNSRSFMTMAASYYTDAVYGPDVRWDEPKSVLLRKCQDREPVHVTEFAGLGLGVYGLPTYVKNALGYNELWHNSTVVLGDGAGSRTKRAWIGKVHSHSIASRSPLYSTCDGRQCHLSTKNNKPGQFRAGLWRDIPTFSEWPPTTVGSLKSAGCRARHGNSCAGWANGG